jgi:hypothetical protein
MDIARHDTISNSDSRPFSIGENGLFLLQIFDEKTDVSLNSNGSPIV